MAQPEETKRVFVEGVEVFAHHGFTAEEQQLGHRFRFDLEVEVAEGRSWGGDALADTVDYGDLVAIVQEVAAGERVRLVETLAAQVLDLIEERLPAATRARVRVAKLQPPVPGVVAAAGAVLERRWRRAGE